MPIELYYHPFSRAAGLIWPLEELGCEYEIRFVDMMSGAQKQPEFKRLNPMGKLPVLVDGELVLTEAAAISMYLGDRYGLGGLSPAFDDPARAAYLRWCLYPASVIEPGCMAHAAKWEYKAASAGWGTYEEMLETIEHAIGEGPYLLGDRFTMADVIFGGTLRWMLTFGMLDKRAAFTDYVGRLDQRPALKKADEINADMREKHGLNQS